MSVSVPLKAGLNLTAYPVRSRRIIEAIGTVPVRRSRCMIGHHCPRVAGRNHLLKQLGEPFKKILPVFIILENPPLFDSSDEDMVQSAGCLSACGHAQVDINAGLTWHAFQIPLSHLLVNKETTPPYPQGRGNAGIPVSTQNPN